MISPRIIFFGTSNFAVEVLETLKSRDIIPALIVTETDKPKGRGQVLSAPEVKVWAERNRVPILQPLSLKKEHTVRQIKDEKPDIFIVAEYGKILPKTILDIPFKGVLNIHPSLLPKYRGPTPIQSAIAEGAEHLGVCIIELDEEMDHGPIIACQEVEFQPSPPDAETAQKKLAQVGAELLSDNLQNYIEEAVKPIKQKHAEATYTKKLVKEDGLIDIHGNAHANWLRFLALHSSPGVYFLIKRKGREIRVKITDAQFTENTFLPTRVIPENKKTMSYEDFMRGFEN